LSKGVNLQKQVEKEMKNPIESLRSVLESCRICRIVQIHWANIGHWASYSRWANLVLRIWSLGEIREIKNPRALLVERAILTR